LRIFASRQKLSRLSRSQIGILESLSLANLVADDH
jgi:hypothetical protein